MIRTLIAILVLGLTLTHNPNINFLGHNHVLPVKLSHGEDFAFIVGFLNGTQIFTNLKSCQECLSVVPAIHDDVVLIIELMDHIKTKDDFWIFIRGVIDHVEHMFEKLKAVEQPCAEMTIDIAMRINNLIKYLHTDWFQKVIFHSVTHLGDIQTKYDAFRATYAEGDYTASGKVLGDLTRFVLFWDFDPELLRFLTILE
jgi:hypothetical protein